MSDEATNIETPAEEPVVEEVQEEVTKPMEDIVENAVSEETETEETTEEVPDDLVAQALARQKELEAEIEALSNADTNVFEKNAILERQLAEAKRLQEAEERNKELQGQLEAIKRESLVQGMIADGRLNNDLKEWADGLSFDQLQAFATKAPKVKTILDQKNPVSDGATIDMEEWKKKMNKSRIVS